MHYLISEVKHSWRIKQNSYRLIFSGLILSLALSASVILGNFFIKDYTAKVSNVNSQASFVTIVQELPSGEALRFTRKAIDVFESNPNKNDLILYARKKIPTKFYKSTSEDLYAGFTNNNFFKYFELPLFKGAYPSGTNQTEILISNGFAQTNQLKVGDAISLVNRTFKISGIYDDTFCGLDSNCIDLLIDVSAYELSHSVGLSKIINRETNSELKKEKIKAYADIDSRFHVFLRNHKNLPTSVINSQLSSLNWPLMTKRIPLSNGNLIFNPELEQSVKRYAVNGVTTTPQSDNELRPVFKIIAYGCITISLICYVLFILEQYIAVNNRVPELTVKTQIGSGLKYWAYFVAIESLVISIPLCISFYVFTYLLTYVFNKIQVLGVLSQGEMLGLSSEKLVIAFLLFIFASLITTALIVISNLRNVTYNRSSVYVSGEYNILNNLLIALAFMFLISGFATALGFVKAVSTTTSPTKLGEYQNVWTISFNHRSDFRAPKSDVVESALSEQNIDFAIYEYEPGLDPINYPKHITRIENDKQSQAYINTVSSDFFNVFDISVIEGRLPLIGSTDEIVINRNLAKYLGLQGKLEKPQKILINDFNFVAKVVGIVQDINYNTPRGVSESIMYPYIESPLSYYKISVIAHSYEQVTNIRQHLQDTLGLEDNDFIIKNRTHSVNLANSFFNTLRSYSLPIGGVLIIILLLIVSGAVQQSLNKRRKELAIRVALGSPILKIAFPMIYTFILPMILGGSAAIYISQTLTSQLFSAWALVSSLQFLPLIFATIIFTSLFIIITGTQIFFKIKASQSSYLR